MPSPKPSKKTPLPKNFILKKEQEGFQEYELQTNGLTVLYYHIPETGVISTNIVYRVGARDEARGETGLAHMLEHMLFKPTKADVANKREGGAMLFERETGAVLNANTWLDRTTYFFSYPKHHFNRALEIEADRMRNVVLSDKEFLPERTNVLSEFDMYNGDPYFALDAAMTTAAFVSHPYGHETIGFREDIASYTAEKLQRFYDRYYWPNNACLIIVGDITVREALETTRAQFGEIPRGPFFVREYPQEPTQEGLRRVEVKRETTTNVLALGARYQGFPSQEWLSAYLLFQILTDGPDSLLYPLLVETGKASQIHSSITPTSHPNLGTITATLTPKTTHAEVERIIFKRLAALEERDVKNRLDRVVAQLINREAFDRDTSLQIALDLTEYVSAGAWTEYLETKKRLRAITPAALLKQAREMFNENRMVIGQFIGTAS